MRAEKAVRDQRFQEIVFNTALWLIDGEWTHTRRAAIAQTRNRRISKVAVDLLKRRARKIRRKATKIGKLDDLHRHKLRIAVKKLRYGCDFFESLFDRPKRRGKYKEALKSLQD